MIWEGDRSDLAGVEAPVYAEPGSTEPVGTAMEVLMRLMFEAFGPSQNWVAPSAWCRRCGCGQASRVDPCWYCATPRQVAA